MEVENDVKTDYTRHNKKWSLPKKIEERKWIRGKVFNEIARRMQHQRR